MNLSVRPFSYNNVTFKGKPLPPDKAVKELEKVLKTAKYDPYVLMDAVYHNKFDLIKEKAIQEINKAIAEAPYEAIKMQLERAANRLK